MITPGEPVVLDTNVWIFGLRRHPGVPSCAQLLDRLAELRVVLPRQVLRELQVNLSEGEDRSLFRLLKSLSKPVVFDWHRANPEVVRKYTALGCKLGDAALAAHLEDLGIGVLVTENRHFLTEIKDLPFRRLTSAELLAELPEQSP